MTPELKDLVRRLRLPYGSCRKEAADAIEALAAALDKARAELAQMVEQRDGAVFNCETLVMQRDTAEALLDEARAENESFYQAGYDAGVDAQHGLTAFQMPAETMVQPVTVAVCRKCEKPIEAGWFRFGSDQAGWEHMQGECPS